jgi:hypothetical protein
MRSAALGFWKRSIDGSRANGSQAAMSDNHHYVPLSQAAKELGISTEALRQRIHRNKMDGYI